MATVVPITDLDEVYYPTSDGEPMGETPFHRKVMNDLIETLEHYFAGDPMTYVSGNMILYYERGNPRKQVVPDLLVAKGVSKDPDREIYQVWREGKAPDLVIEVTSKTTAGKHQEEKTRLYQDVLKVPEYFLFDPRGDYLQPPLKSYRLSGGVYVPVQEVNGRLPSQVLGLHLECHGPDLWMVDPGTGQRLLTPRERLAQAEAEVERLRRELEQLRGPGGAAGGGGNQG